MANKEISGLTAAAAIAPADLFHISQSGNSRKATGAQLSTFCGNLQPDYVAGRWYPMAIGTNGTGAAGQNVIQFCIFALLKPITISDLGCFVRTAQASNNVQLAIYAADPSTFYPTGNPLAVTGNISTASATAVSADITGPNVFLPAGFYHAAVNHSGATSVVDPYSAGGAQQSSKVGSTTLANIVGTSNNNLKLTFASTFGTWPDMTGQTLTETNAAPGPMLYLKAA